MTWASDSSGIRSLQLLSCVHGCFVTLLCQLQGRVVHLGHFLWKQCECLRAPFHVPSIHIFLCAAQHFSILFGYDAHFSYNALC